MGGPPGSPDLRFVLGLYQDLLERAISLGEVQAGAANGWRAALARLGPQGVIAQFEQTLEYRMTEVRNLYQRYLRRDPDPAGLVGWAGFLATHTVEDLALQLIISGEYARLHGGSLPDLLDAVYSDALGRPIDPGTLASGLAVPQLAYIVLQSAEYRTDEVFRDYATFLGRPGSPGEVSGWVSLYALGLNDQAVLAALLGIPGGEYFGLLTQ
jgi:hypothetical protein